MSTAQSILVGYGILVLLYGFILGIPLAVARSSAPQASRQLVTAHLSGLMQGPVAMVCAFAIGAVSFESTWATAAACLLVAGLVAETVGGTLNWLQGTGDQFAEKSVGFRINALTGVLAIPGLAVLAVGVIGRL